jgi:nitroreductase
MIMQRRKFICIVGSSGLIFAAGSMLPAAASDMPDPYAAWIGPSPQDQDVRRWALAHAILAPNPHNLQPWIVDLHTPDQITVYHDISRTLPNTDPYSRQLMIGHGAFLELLDLAARQRGMRLNMRFFPKGEYGSAIDNRPLARVQFVADPRVKLDPLFLQILRRRTNRTPYDMKRAIARPIMESLCTAAGSGVRAGYTVDAPRVGPLCNLVEQAWDLEVSLPRVWGEGVRVTRLGADEIAANPDGVSLKGLPIAVGKLLGLVSRKKMMEQGSFIVKQSLEFGRQSARSTPAFAWIVTPDNGRTAQIDSGRAYVRMQLAATAAGLSMHPNSQALQEYPEMVAHYREVKRLLGAKDVATVQVLMRVGYAQQAADPAPRWPLARHFV